MATRIENPTHCEIRAVIRFLQAKNIQPADIHRQVCQVYGEGAMSDSMVRRWCRQFESGRDNLHDDKPSGRPSVVTPDLVQQIEVKIRENRDFTITDLAEFFPNVSRKTVHRIVTENLHFRKLYTRWVPKFLPQNTKRNVWDLHSPFWSATRRTAMSFSNTSLPVMKHGYPMSPQKVSNSPCSGVTHHPQPKKKKKVSRLSALAKSCARYSGAVMEFCSLITVQMGKQSMPRCTTTLYNAYAGLLKQTPGTTQLRGGSSPRQRPSAYGSANNSPTAAISLGYQG